MPAGGGTNVSREKHPSGARSKNAESMATVTAQTVHRASEGIKAMLQWAPVGAGGAELPGKEVPGDLR